MRIHVSETNSEGKVAAGKVTSAKTSMSTEDEILEAQSLMSFSGTEHKTRCGERDQRLLRGVNRVFLFQTLDKVADPDQPFLDILRGYRIRNADVPVRAKGRAGDYGDMSFFKQQFR